MKQGCEKGERQQMNRKKVRNKEKIKILDLKRGKAKIYRIRAHKYVGNYWVNKAVGS